MRSDYMAGLICAVLGNIHRTKDAKAFAPDDFIPRVRTAEINESDQVVDEAPVDLAETTRQLERMLGRNR